MAKVKEGDRVRIKVRPVTEEDRTMHMFFEHMQGLEGNVSNYYNTNEVAVTIDLTNLVDVPKDVHALATSRIQEKFKENATEEVKRLLTKEEMLFTPNYVLLLREQDLELV
jgi:ssDNA-specific exonuclease RecJ